MLTLTSQYALQAVCYLARHTEDCPVPRRKIADDLGIPVKYLGHILGKLTRSGTLVASPGTGGGFRLARAASGVCLAEVVTPFEPVAADPPRCPFATAECEMGSPCPGHEGWVRVMGVYLEYLKATSVEDVAIRWSKGMRIGKRKRRR